MSEADHWRVKTAEIMAKGSKSTTGKAPESGSAAPAAPPESAKSAEGKAAAKDSAASKAETPKPDTSKPDSGKPDSAKPWDRAGSSADAQRPPPPRRRGNAPLFALIGIVVVLAAAGWATWPIWSIHLAGALPGARPGPAVADLERRVEKLEAATMSKEPAVAVTDLEAQRAKFSAELAAIVKRLDDLEQAAAVARRMAATTTGTKDSANASLQALSQRLEELKSGDVGKLEERLRRLESTEKTSPGADMEARKALAATVDDLARRMRSVESATAKDTLAAERGRALVLVVAQLRETLRGSGPFGRDLEALAAIGGDDPEVTKAVAMLKPLAAKGLPSVAELRDRFDPVATAVSQAAGRAEGDGWMARTVDRLSSLVTVRRVDGKADDTSVDGILTRAEMRLKEGDLGGAVRALDDLTGPASAAAQPWLKEARTRLAVDRALATLHGRAIAMLGPAKG